MIFTLLNYTLHDNIVYSFVLQKYKVFVKKQYMTSKRSYTQLHNVYQSFNITKVTQDLHALCPTNQNINNLVMSYVTKDNPVVYDNILVIIAAFFEDYEDVFRIHNILYRKTFPKIVFCGPTKKPSLDKSYPFVYFRELTKTKELFYMCVNNAINMYNDSSIDGYLFLSDDMLFFHWNVNFSTEILNKIWLKEAQLNIFDLRTNCHTEGGRKFPTNCAKPTWTPLQAHRSERKNARNTLTQMKDSNETVLSNCFNTLTMKNGGPFRVNYDWFMGDMFYIPASITDEYLLISERFLENNLIHALAIPTIAKCFEDTHGINYLPGVNDLKSRPLLKRIPEDIINSAVKKHKPFVHPYKFSGIISGKKPRDIGFFCNTLLPLYYSN